MVECGSRNNPGPGQAHTSGFAKLAVDAIAAKGKIILDNSWTIRARRPEIAVRAHASLPDAAGIL